MNDIIYIISITDDINELYHYVCHLKSREDKLIAIKAINDIKAKDKSLSRAERLSYIKLQMDLMELVCIDDKIKNRFFETIENESDKIIRHPVFSEIEANASKVLSMIKETRRFLKKKVIKY